MAKTVMLLIFYMMLISGQAQDRGVFMSVKPSGDTVYIYEFTPEEVRGLRLKIQRDSMCTTQTANLQDQLYNCEILVGSWQQKAFNADQAYKQLATQVAKDASTLRSFSKEQDKLIKEKQTLSDDYNKLKRKNQNLKATATIFGTTTVVSGVLLFFILR